MLRDASAPTDTEEVKENDVAKEAPLPKHTGKGTRAMQGPPDDTAAASPPPPPSEKGHLVPATALDRVNRTLDERKAEAIAQEEFPGKKASELPDKTVQGLGYEGMTQRSLEDEHDTDNVAVHPKGLKLRDGRPIEPDFAVKDDKGNVVELVDAKGYTRKDVSNPDAAASSLTHMQNLKHAARYAEADAPNLGSATFALPRETADQPAVQDAVASLGTTERPVTTEAIGSEAELKQRMAELKMDPAERGKMPEGLIAEVDQIAQLPIEQREAAMGQLTGSLRDERGDETITGAYLREHGRIERNGAGITIIDDAGKEHTVWYKKLSPRD